MQAPVDARVMGRFSAVCLGGAMLFALGCTSLETPESPPGTPRTPRSLAFVSMPVEMAAGYDSAAGIEVDVVDDMGVWAPTATDQVSILLKDSRGADTLATIQAVRGIVRLDTIAPRRWGSGFWLVASAPGLRSVASDTFNILPPPVGSLQASARRIVARRSAGR